MRELTPEQREDFSRIVTPYLARREVLRMGDFVQHGTVSTLAHCLRVARTCYAWASALGLRVDMEDLVVGALLHDFYLYDWHDRSTSRPHHATMHPLYAAENAVELLGVSDDVRAIIESHMWPLPPGRPPRSREALVLCAADKWCSLAETLLMRRAPRGERGAGQSPAPAAAKAAPAPAATRGGGLAPEGGDRG